MTHIWQEKEQSSTVIFRELWEMYNCSWPMKSDDKYHDLPYLQRMEMLQEIIRRCMRSEHESYLNGKATAGRVAETKGHAILLGKIIAEEKRK